MIGLILSLLFIIITYYFTGSTSCLSISIFNILLGVLFASFAKKKIKALDVFGITFSVYTLLALFHHFDVILYNQWMAPDEMGYRNFCNWGAEVNSFKEIINVLIEDSGITQFGYQHYIFFISTFGYIAKHLFDGPNPMFMIQISVIAGSLSAIILFRIMCMYFDQKLSMFYTLIFMLISPFCENSTLFLRDIYIAFVFLCGYLVALKKFNIGGVVVLLLLAYIAWGIRPANGAFFLILVLYYFYNKYKRARKLILSLSVVMIIVAFFLSSEVDSILEHMDAYNELNETQKEGQTASAAFVRGLPSPIKEITQIVYTLIHPFPNVIGLRLNVNFYRFIIGGIVTIIGTYLWFITSFSLTKWTYQKKLRYIDEKLFLLFLINILYLCLNYQNFTTRRTLPGLPISFLVFALIYEKYTTLSNRKKTVLTAFSIYFVLTLILLR